MILSLLLLSFFDKQGMFFVEQYPATTQDAQGGGGNGFRLRFDERQGWKAAIDHP
jgi:hypothetical protein